MADDLAFEPADMTITAELPSGFAGRSRYAARKFSSEFQKWFLLAALLGAITGYGIAGMTIVAGQLALGSVLESNLWPVFLFVPTAGLILATLIIRWVTPDRSPATTEAFIANYHEDGVDLGWRSIPGKMAAAMATVGSGASAGFEGPSIYFGAAIGSTMEIAFPDRFGRDETKALTVAGAAAGLAAIFRAPLTGIFFAVEGPYMFDLVRFAVAPSLIAASTSYIAYSLVIGWQPLFPLDTVGSQIIPVKQLLFAIVVGILCSFAARLFIAINRWVAVIAERLPVVIRVGVFGLGVGGLGLLSFALVGQPLLLGEGIPGARLFEAGSFDSSTMPVVALLVLLVVLKMLATALTLKGGGVGGQFFPLAFIGAGIGAVFSHLLSPSDPSLYPVIGIAAMIGSAFRAPLTAVAFIAETSGSTAYLIPGLIAAAVANSLMGSRSISKSQREHPLSSLTAARRIPLRRLVSELPTPRTVASTMTLHEYAAGQHDEPSYVMDGDRLVGIVTKEKLFSVDFELRRNVRVGDVMDSDMPRFAGATPLRDAVARLFETHHDSGVVLDEHERPIGIISEEDILRTQEGAKRVRTSRKFKSTGRRRGG